VGKTFVDERVAKVESSWAWDYRLNG